MTSQGYGVKFLTQDVHLSSLSAEQLALRREPIHLVAQSIGEMCNATHANNVFQDYLFNTVSQAKKIEYIQGSDQLALQAKQ